MEAFVLIAGLRRPSGSGSVNSVVQTGAAYDLAGHGIRRISEVFQAGFKGSAFTLPG